MIMISGLQETDSVIRCIEAGAEDYLTKPFNPVLLRARISACLERKRWRERERRYLERIESSARSSEALLRNILPGQIVTRLNDGEVVIADRVEEVDHPVRRSGRLHRDRLAAQPGPSGRPPQPDLLGVRRSLPASCGIEKIKTIGDAYMAAAGLPQPRPGQRRGDGRVRPRHARRRSNALNQTLETPFQIRIGIHTGPVDRRRDRRSTSSSTTSGATR